MLQLSLIPPASAEKWGLFMNKKHLTSWAALTAAAAIAVSGCFGNHAKIKETGETETTAGLSQKVMGTGPSVSHKNNGAVDYAEDFYTAVNYDTLAGWEIPADQAYTGWFQKLREENYHKLDGIIRQVSSENGLEEGSDPYAIRALNLTGLDRETRDREGYGRKLGDFLKEVDEAGSVKELLEACLHFQRDYGTGSLMGFQYGADSGNSSEKALYLLTPDTGLNKEVWFAQDTSNKKVVEAYKKYLTRLYENSGQTTQEAQASALRVTAMMKDLASSSLSLEELYDAEKTYHVYTAKDAAALCTDALPFQVPREIYGIGEDEKTIIEQPDLCKKLAEYLTEDKLMLLKEYVKACLYSDFSMVTGSENLDAGQEYQMAVHGTEEKKAFERTVSENVQEVLGFECGRVFSGTYFDEKAKKDVTDMIRQVIEVYDQRLGDMEWMSEATRREARNKLASITIKAGYPDIWPQDQYRVILKDPENGGVYVDNILEIMKGAQDYQFKTRRDPVDKSRWLISPQTVNAYYAPTNNEIVFPMGILQPPFYDPEADPVVNLGGIGMVIGHEITHAFDTSGSQYDANGNLRDWWTAGDKRKFKELAQKVTRYYNTMEINGMHVNGSRTVTENIADLGSMSCITEIAKQKGYDLKEMYKAYAVIWACKYREEYLSYLITNDTHAPGMIRVNAVLSAIQDFYTAFGVKEGDGMYRRPEERPEIW